MIPSTTDGAQLPQRTGVSSVGCSTACRREPLDAVGALTNERFEITDDELEQHIDDLAWSWRTAYDRFQAHGIPADREEALILLQLHNRAVLSRSPAAQAVRWAEIERAIDDGVGFFDAAGRRAREALERSQ